MEAKEKIITDFNKAKEELLKALDQNGDGLFDGL